MIRNHSFLDFWYSIRFALFPLWVRTQGSILGGGARVQNLGHLENVLFIKPFSSLSSYLTNKCRNLYLFGSYIPFRIELYSVAPNSKGRAGGQNLGHIDKIQ